MNMNIFKQSIIAALLFGALVGCGSSADSASNFVESGKELLAEGKAEKARLEFKNAIQVDPRMAEPFYQLALIDEKEQKWKGMFANLTTVEQLAPTHYEAIVKLGQINLLAGNFDVALEKANKVIEADKENVAAWVLRSSIAMKQQNYESAMSDIEHALMLDAKNIEALSVKTLVLNMQGKTDQALSVIDKALIIKPDQLPLMMIKLSILEGLKNYAAMEQLYQSLLIQRPDESWVPVSLAKLLNVQDRYSDAKKVLEAYVSAHPDDKQTKLLLVSLVKTKEPNQAIILLDSYIKQEPDNYELRFSKVKLLLDKQDVDAAVVSLKEIVSLDAEGNDGRKAKVVLAGFDLQQGNEKAALKQAQEVLDVAPEDEGALLLKARIEIANKNIDTAVTHLRVVLRNNPESDQALVLLAQAYMGSGSKELADDNFRQALAVNPGNTIAALSIANDLMKSSDLNRTEEVLTKALQKATNKEPLLQALAQVRILKKDWPGTEAVIDSLRVDKRDTALTYYLSGRVSQGQALLDSAITQYKAALAVRPDMARALQGLASSSLQLGQKEQLITYLGMFLEKNPTQVTAYAVLSDIYIQEKNWDKAIVTMEKGIAKEPRWQVGYSTLASVYLAQNNAKQAISTYQRGLDENKNSNFLALQMASAYERLTEFSKAKVLYEEILARDPSVEPAINNLASLLTDQFPSEENLTKAMVLAERFKTSTEPYYMDTYAWTYVLSGDLVKAQSVLERVISLSPNVAVFNYHIGALYLKQGKILEAENYLNIAKSLAEKQGDKITAEKVVELLQTL
jgi:tetratricopeptide (TPR) repeat protein